MKKILKFSKIFFLILYLIVIFLLMLENKQITSDYNLPVWAISGLFFISIFYFCYKYIILKIKDDELEDEIISIVNHAFRTPITSIIWHTKELEKNISQNEKLLYLQNINNGATKILNVVDSLVGIKDVQNTSGYFFEAVSLREIVESSINKHRGQINRKNIDFRIPVFKDIPLLTVDLKKISFVIDSLIENAIYYTKKDGKILIDSIYDFNKLVLFVSDTGIGLGMMDKLRIFSKFYRSEKAKLMNPDGMGLRLYISREIIKRHRGKIYAKSNGLNEGATFFIEIPFKKK